MSPKLRPLLAALLLATGAYEGIAEDGVAVVKLNMSMVGFRGGDVWTEFEELRCRSGRLSTRRLGSEV